MYLFIDTETTGFPKKNGGLIQEGQARIYQYGMILTDVEGNSLSEFASFIKPDGWEPGAYAFRTRGVTTETCEKYGMDAYIPYGVFMRLAAMAETVVAFNSAFDKQMVEIEAAHLNKPFAKTPWFCAMKEAQVHCGTARWPKQDYALEHLCGKKLEGAHDALNDVRACKDIFFETKRRREEAMAKKERTAK